LDEIGDFSPRVQVKMLRVIQERQYERVGSSRTNKANVRIIAATNRDLEEAIENGGFRQDLYYRINVFPIYLPPLRERKSDILLLCNSFIKKYSKQMGKKIDRISTTAINMLCAYNWPGNVRELENCIEHAVLLANEKVIHGHNLPETLQMPQSTDLSATGSLKQKIEVMEKDLIIDSLKRNSGNVSAVARELGISGRMVRYKLEKMNIRAHKFLRSMIN
ncbi:MAG: sigma 54-interacting transcriptional regulator, partial [Victivallales bacterium]